MQEVLPVGHSPGSIAVPEVVKPVAKLEAGHHIQQATDSADLHTSPSRTGRVKEHPSKIWLALFCPMQENPQRVAFLALVNFYGVRRAWHVDPLPS